MKKTYSRPEIKVKAIATEALLAASPNGVEYSGGKQTIGLENNETDADGGAKRGLFDKTFDWDEE